MTPSEHPEIERKYDVSTAAVLPPLTDVAGVAEVGVPVDHELDAVYLDTEAFDLARRGITLRRRTGGDDEGWHLKLPVDNETRKEVRLPLGDDETVPEALLEAVRGWVRDHPLRPVAHITSRRREYPLLDAGQRVLARVTDDQVRAERLGVVALDETSDERPRAWREWEVELASGDPGILDAVESTLRAAGAEPATAGSKLLRTLGEALPRQRAGSARKELAKGSAGELLLAHLREQTEALHRLDAAVRAGRPAAVHKMRIAARRLRSALTTYRPILGPGAAEALREDLRWLGQALAKARDAHVLRQHLDSVVAAQPAELVLGPVVARIDRELAKASATGAEEGRAAMVGAQYFRLLDALDALLEDPPLADEAGRSARGVVVRLVARDAKRLRRAVRAVERAERGSEARDLALHEARKKAKRLRYAAESAERALGPRAARYAARAKAVQETLGLHQDAVVARRALRDYGVRAHLSGENGFTFGLLYGLELRRADEAERAFEKAWDRLPHQQVRGWLRH